MSIVFANMNPQNGGDKGSYWRIVCVCWMHTQIHRTEVMGAAMEDSLCLLDAL